MEQRLIDANVLMERLERKKCEPAKVRYTEGYNDALMRFRSMVHGAPTVDAVPVVRCSKCRMSFVADESMEMYGAEIGKRYCSSGRKVTDDFFCADGKRKERT